MSRIDTISIGLEHFIDKIGYQSKIYDDNNIGIKYLVNDVSCYSDYYKSKYSADITIVSMNPVIRIFQTISLLLLHRPRYIELYCTGRLTFFYCILSKIFMCKLIIILRGCEFSYDAFSQKLIDKALYLSDGILCKEYNLFKEIENRKLIHKTSFIHNAVPVEITDSVEKLANRDIDILFMNTPRPSRNLELLISSIKMILDTKPRCSICFAGFSILDRDGSHIEKEYQINMLKFLKELGIYDKIKIMGFVKEPSLLLKRSKVFVFPADVVFCNYTLLEAMSYGCIPIVTDGEGADEIVNHKVNGYISTKDINLLCSYINKAIVLSPENDKMSLLSKQCIVDGYGIDSWFSKVDEMRKKI